MSFQKCSCIYIFLAILSYQNYSKLITAETFKCKIQRSHSTPTVYVKQDDNIAQQPSLVKATKIKGKLFSNIILTVTWW